jgi:polysaccharide export outer membrane protein
MATGGTGMGEDKEGNSRGVRECFVVLIAVLAVGCSSRAQMTVEAEAAAREAAVKNKQEIVRSSVKYQKEYLLFAGDQIEVLTWRNPEVTRTVTIRPDGYISLPLLQEVKAGGLTPAELAASVTKAYSGRLLNPEVTVIPVQVRQPTVYVLGDVRNPGAFPARQAVTALQALAAAGGALRSGWESETVVIRLSQDGYLEATPVGGRGGGEWFLTDQVGPYRLLGNTPLQPDDIVFVPETGRSQLFRALADILIPFQIYMNYRLIETTLK